LTVLTLAVFSALGIWYSRDRVSSIEDFISARGSAGPGMTTATLVASVMGVWILLSVPEAGAAFGGIAAVTGYAIGEALPMIAYAKLGPRIRELIPEGHSLTEYVYARYGAAMYAFILIVSLFYMFIFLAAELTGITSALQLVGGVPRWQTAFLVGGFVLLYTGYGGLQASIFTDTLQTLLLLPLLVVTFVGAVFALGGTGAVHAAIVSEDPALIDPGFFAGLRFGVWVAVAILGAELVNQTWWQRIYAARDAETLRRGFGVAAVANAVVVFLAGLFGVLARGHVEIVTAAESPEYNASIALFLLLEEAFSEPLVLGITLLALLLVMSSADTLFNAMASVVTADLPRLVADPADRTLRIGARTLTVVVALAAIYVSLRARSVLRLFLLADLLGAAVMVPLLAGLYSERVTGGGALVSGLAGLAVGLTFYGGIRPFVAGLPGVGLLPTPDNLIAFPGAAAVSAIGVLLTIALSSSRFDLERLGREIHTLDDSARTDGGTRDRSSPGKSTRTGTGASPGKSTRTGTGASPGKSTRTGTGTSPGKNTRTGTGTSPGKNTRTGTPRSSRDGGDRP
jgi:Na+/proline symporter